MITISKLRDRLKLPKERDGEYADIRDGLVALWEEETKRLWSRRAGYVEYFSPDQTKRISSIFLSLWPIEAITKVEEKRRSSTTWTELDATSYAFVDPTRNRVDRVNCSWAEQVRVTYTGGYTPEPTVGASPAQYKTPLDVQEGLLVQAHFMQVRHAANRVSVSSENFQGGAGVFLRADLHPYFAELIAQKVRKV